MFQDFVLCIDPYLRHRCQNSRACRHPAQAQCVLYFFLYSRFVTDLVIFPQVPHPNLAIRLSPKPRPNRRPTVRDILVNLATRPHFLLFPFPPPFVFSSFCLWKTIEATPPGHSKFSSSMFQSASLRGFDLEPASGLPTSKKKEEEERLANYSSI